MRKIIYILLMLCLPIIGLAQSNTVSQVVNVQRDYIPEINKATKTVFMPTTEELPKIDFRSLVYNIAYRSEPMETRYNALSMPMYERTLYHDLNSGYFDIMVGAPIQSKVDLYYTTKVSTNLSMGVGYKNRGFYGKLDNNIGERESAFDMSNALALMLQYRKDRLEVFLDVNINSRLFDRYAYAIPENSTVDPSDISRDSVRQSLLKGYVTISIGTPMSDDNIFNGRFRGAFSFISDSYGYAEQITYAGITYSTHKINNKHRFLVDLDYQIMVTGGSSKQIPPVLLPGQDEFKYNNVVNQDIMPYSTLFIYPRYSFGSGIWSLDLGAKMTLGVGNMWYDKKTTFVTPTLDVKAEFKGGAISPYIKIDGNYRYNTYYNLSSQNPFLVNGLTAPNTSEYYAKIGISGFVGNSFNYDLYAGYEILKDDVLFVNSLNNNTFITALSDYNNFIAGVSMRYTISNNFTVEGNWNYAYYNNTDQDNSRNSYGLPEHQAFLKFGYNGNIFGMYIKTDIQSKREFISKYSGVTKLSTNMVSAKADLSLGGYYKINKDFSINLELNNILNQELYKYNYYRGIGLNGLIGVSMKF